MVDDVEPRRSELEELRRNGPPPDTWGEAVAAVQANVDPATVAEIDRLAREQRRAELPEPHPSWVPSDIAAVLAGDHEVPEPTILHRADGCALFYPGRTHSVHGETEAAKSFLVLAAAAETLRTGGDVTVVDMEMGVIEVVERLLALGVRPDILRVRLHHYQPESPAITWDRYRQATYDVGNWAAWADAWADVDLVIVDTTAAWFALHGLDGMSAADVEAANQYLLEPAARSGPAVVSVDHVVKDREHRGRWSSGSERKVSGLTGAAYSMETLAPLARGRTGRFRLLVAKDRPGFVRGQSIPFGTTHIAGIFEIRSAASTGALSWSIDLPDEKDTAPLYDEAMLVAICEAITTHTNINGRAPSGNQVEVAVAGKATRIRQHLEHLLALGRVVREPGPGSGFRYSLPVPLTDIRDPDNGTSSPRPSPRPTSSRTR